MNIIKNNKGNIGIALVVIVISIVSALSLTSIGFSDSVKLNRQHQYIQHLHNLRSQVSRGRIVLSYNQIQGNVPNIIRLPLRKFDKYNINTTIETKNDFFIIKSLSEVENKETRRYGQNIIQNLQSMAIFHYFTDVDRGPDDIPGNIRFYGGDEVHGRTHSNSDIWIRQAGGGSNDGWPIFTGLVTTSGRIRVYGGGDYPKDRIFRGGLIEHYPRVMFQPNAESVRKNGKWIGSPSDKKIAFVTMNGRSYTLQIGEIQKSGYEEIDIYDKYPPYDSIGTVIGKNSWPIIDTVWAGQTSGINNRSIFVPMELWISGQVSGNQTWASSHNIYIKDDITYRGTEKGKQPDNPKHINKTDYFGLISEKNIYIQYGYKDPNTNKRVRPNSDNMNGIYLYGAYLASGKGDDPKDDGIFTFQYQFPKGSTPDQQYWISPPCNCGKNNRVVTLSDKKDENEAPEWLTKIDLHLLKYNYKDWDNGVDYPLYNPLWPEPGPIYPHSFGYTGFTKTPVPPTYQDTLPRVVWLRGTIHLYGSIAQRRRGFVRRSGNPDFDAGPSIGWDLEQQLYGVNVGPTGYDKDYNFDTRFEKVNPNDFPLVKFQTQSNVYGQNIDLGYKTIAWRFKSPKK